MKATAPVSAQRPQRTTAPLLLPAQRPQRTTAPLLLPARRPQWAWLASVFLATGHAIRTGNRYRERRLRSQKAQRSKRLRPRPSLEPTTAGPRTIAARARARRAERSAGRIRGPGHARD